MEGEKKANVPLVFLGRAVSSRLQYCFGSAYTKIGTIQRRFGIPIVMIGGMLRENCTIGEELCWSEETKAYVLGSYFYGFCAQSLVVSIVKKYDIFLPSYRVYIVLAIIVQFLYPMLAEKSVTTLIIVQAIRGLFAGLMAPYNIEFLNNWLTVKQRKYFLSCVGMSIHFGNGTGGLIASFFTNVLNWKWYFYFGGFLLSVGFIMNILFVSKYPGGSLFEMTFIAKEPTEMYTKVEERESIEEETGREESDRKEDKFRIRSVLKRVYVWSFVVYMVTYFTV
eukprot:sb/3467904/